MSKARLVLTALFAEHQTPTEVAARYGVHRGWVYKLWFPPNRGGFPYAASRVGAAVFS